MTKFLDSYFVVAAKRVQGSKLKSTLAEASESSVMSLKLVPCFFVSFWFLIQILVVVGGDENWKIVVNLFWFDFFNKSSGAFMKQAIYFC